MTLPAVQEDVKIEHIPGNGDAHETRDKENVEGIEEPLLFRQVSLNGFVCGKEIEKGNRGNSYQDQAVQEVNTVGDTPWRHPASQVVFNNTQVKDPEKEPDGTEYRSAEGQESHRKAQRFFYPAQPADNEGGEERYSNKKNRIMKAHFSLRRIRISSSSSVW